MNAVTINNYPVTVKEYKGQRVITFKDIDSVHGRAEGTASRNFRENKNRFIDGKDYFRRNSSEAKKEYNYNAPNGLILITESGYLMLVKSLTDDTAWAVQRQLVDTYFKAKTPYALSEKRQEENRYEYFEKTYDGEVVVTAEDIAQATGLSVSSVRYYIKARLKKGVEYYHLKREAMAAYKIENPRVSRVANDAIVINRKGFITLMRAMGYKGKTKLFFELSTPEKEAEPKKQEYLHVAENCSFGDLVKRTKEKLTTLGTLLDMINRYNMPLETAESYVNVIQACGSDISFNVDAVKRKISEIPRSTSLKI